MEKRVRMADIAQKLGISIVSVSKGLAGKEGVSAQMREKIISTANEMGYDIRTKEQSQKTISGNIGILVADRFVADNAFYPALYRQIMISSAEFGYSAIMEIVSPQAELNGAIPTIISAGKVDGIVFMGELSRDYLKAVIKTGIPYILLDFYDEELSADSVTSDNITGGFRVTNALLKKGYREIGFVGSILATSSIMDRYLGYTKALLRAGISVREEWRLEDRDENGKFIMLKLPQVMPRAFVCNCDEMAYNLVELLRRRGLRVPKDVAVAGYDDYQFALICDPPLTTYHVNVEDMGRVAAAQLLRKIKGKRFTGGNTVVSGKLVSRGST